ncbi:hypothetical protein RFX64_00095 [Streptococcus mutans]|uniref:hypothetical protein n=2 Tax=Streptococcus mutans TaxID=1309 RepID=UPI001BDE94CA|nr:hypothetical protein [Streptococcus mutans]MDW5556055.1 hypothetical protein [Streptococcus mutans]
MDSLIKIGDRLLKDRFYRIIMLTIGLQIVISVVLFVVSYIGGTGGNDFQIASFIDMFATVIFHQRFIANPLQNVILQSSELIVIYVLVYYFKGYALKRRRGFSYLSETKEWTIPLPSYNIKVSEESLNENLRFGFLVNLTLYLSLFYFWIYRGQLPQSVFVVLVLIACFLILRFFIFVLEMRKMGQYIMIQLIFFEPEKMDKVLDVFDRWYQKQSVFLKYEDVDEYVKLFIDLNIFRAIEKMSLKDIADYGKISITIADDILELFEREYHRYLENNEQV